MKRKKTNRAPLLPHSTILVTTQSGYKIDPNEPLWILDKDTTINLGFLEQVNSKTSGFIRSTLLERVKNHMPRTIEGDCVVIRNYLGAFDSFDSKNFYKWVGSR